MGIDIYLGGHDAYEERTKDARSSFDMAVKLRDSHPRGSKEAKTAQGLVELASAEMWAGRQRFISRFRLP
jgi:hypothetical protein